MVLNKRAVFGDYGLLFDLKSNISFRTLSDPNDDCKSVMYIPESVRTSFMCCKKEVFLDLCELFPVTGELLKELSLHKRDIYLHYLKTVKNMKETLKHSGVPRGIDSRAGLFRKNKKFGRNVITLSDSEDEDK